MGKLIVLLIGFFIVMLASISIYDARKIAINNFNEGETNSATKTLKIVGYVLALIGMSLIYIAK